MGLPPERDIPAGDPDRNRHHFLEAAQVWSARWVWDLRGEVADGLLSGQDWCERCTASFLQEPDAAALRRAVLARCRRGALTEAISDICLAAWSGGRPLRQPFSRMMHALTADL
eukprot:7551369-Pyramimonas_sp.AAC.1